MLSADQVGWDWFSVQLDGGQELMLCHLRNRDGSIGAFSSGTLVGKDGSTRTLAREDFAIRTLARWTSPHSGGVYPAAWQIEVPSASLTLEVRPRLADQELRTAQSTGVTYWEGCCAVRGEHHGEATGGDAYVELVGYAGKVAWF
ncbi:MAG: lipocalin family protein [Planctomycetota bacterium]